MILRNTLLFLIMILFSSVLTAGQLRVAVAANFKTTLAKIALRFEQKTHHKIVIIAGSSGTLFSQISHGAPYDIFLSADSVRPQKLVKNNLAIKDSLLTYAIGQLAFWAPNNQVKDLVSVANIIKKQKGKLAIANPRLAPYGTSAFEFMIKNNIEPLVNNKLIKGNNVVQAFQFVESGNADSGIISYSQLVHSQISQHFLLLPHTLYPAINQQAVILKNTKQLALAKQFLAFLKEQNKTLIINDGYLVETTNVS
ncbi:MAG: molybdate ABC transporter substrate-binding protein [Gammaproteobacteria bacterium]|nr:molybdate ABC transporter substrate-binding protein [Gammaproteobacteria bacterium]